MEFCTDSHSYWRTVNFSSSPFFAVCTRFSCQSPWDCDTTNESCGRIYTHFTYIHRYRKIQYRTHPITACPQLRALSLWHCMLEWKENTNILPVRVLYIPDNTMELPEEVSDSFIEEIAPVHRQYPHNTSFRSDFILRAWQRPIPHWSYLNA